VLNVVAVSWNMSYTQCRTTRDETPGLDDICVLGFLTSGTGAFL
jgi:hypothetical protein